MRTLFSRTISAIFVTGLISAPTLAQQAPQEMCIRDRIIAAQRKVCREMGCAYWDERARMGGFGTMREWVNVGWGQPDHTHFTGEGYTELAAALFSDIVQQYNSYQAAPAIATGEAK